MKTYKETPRTKAERADDDDGGGGGYAAAAPLKYAPTFSPGRVDGGTTPLPGLLLAVTGLLVAPLDREK